MTRAQICKCGHMKSEHGSKKIGKEYVVSGGPCSYEECSCIRFNFDHFELKTRGTNKKILDMKNLNKQGKPYGS